MDDRQIIRDLLSQLPAGSIRVRLSEEVQKIFLSLDTCYRELLRESGRAQYWEHKWKIDHGVDR